MTSLRRVAPGSVALIASLFLFVGTAFAGWPETCDEGETFGDPQIQGETCTSTGMIVVHSGIEFCRADCSNGAREFSMPTSPE